jgi:hypothetical protein
VLRNSISGVHTALFQVSFCPPHAGTAGAQQLTRRSASCCGSMTPPCRMCMGSCLM